MGKTHILSLAAQPINVFSLQMWHHLKQNQKTFLWYKIYCQETVLQKDNQINTNFLHFCAKFRWFIGTDYQHVGIKSSWT